MNKNIVFIGEKSYILNYASGLVTYEEIPTWHAIDSGFKYAYGGVNTYLCKLTNVKSIESVTINDSKIVTITATNVDNKNITIEGTGYTLALDSNIRSPQYTTAHFSLTGNTATYKSASNTAGYTLVDNKIVYTPMVGETDLFTITGVKSIEGLALNGITVTVNESSLNQSDVTISEGYTLELAEGITAPQYTNARFILTDTTAKYKSASNTAGYTLADNKIVYTPMNAEIDLFTLTNIQSIEGISINAEDKTVTVVASALTADSKSTILNDVSNSGYTLVIAGIDNTTDDTTPSSDDVTLPANDTTPSSDDVTLPAEDTIPSSDDVTLPADDTTPSSNDVTLPAEDTIPSEDDVTIPAEVTIPGSDTSQEVQEKLVALADELTSNTDTFESITVEVVTDEKGNSTVVPTDGNAKLTLLDNIEGTTTANYSQTSGKKDVTTSTGNQTIIFNSEGSNIARISKNTTGDKVVETGGGGDIVINSNKDVAVTIKSSGDDTIVASGGTGEKIELGNGNAVIIAAEGANVSNYDISTGSGVILLGVENLSDALIDGVASLTDRSLNYNKNSKLNISKATNNTTVGTFVNVYTSSSAENSSIKALVG